MEQQISLVPIGPPNTNQLVVCLHMHVMVGTDGEQGDEAGLSSRQLQAILLRASQKPGVIPA